MFSGRLWTMRQYAGFGTARENQPPLPPAPRGRADRGFRPPSTCDADGLGLRPPHGAWRTGRRGHRTRPDSREVPRWTACSTSITINATAAICWLSKEDGVARAKLTGTVLKEYVAQGERVARAGPWLVAITAS